MHFALSPRGEAACGTAEVDLDLQAMDLAITLVALDLCVGEPLQERDAS